MSTQTHIIASHLVDSLTCGNMEGLTVNELKALVTWLLSANSPHNAYAYISAPCGNATCEVLKRLVDCHTVTFKKREEPTS